jgi:signal peptidase I
LLPWLALAVVASLGFAAWQLRNVRLLSVQSGSMSPVVQKGDAVVVERGNLQSLQPGEIISYHSPVDQRVIITHRIIAIREEQGVIITQGDRLPQADPQIASQLVIGRAVSSVAGLGLILDWLHSAWGLALAVYAPAAVIVVLEFRRLFRYFAGSEYHLTGRAYS